MPWRRKSKNAKKVRHHWNFTFYVNNSLLSLRFWSLQDCTDRFSRICGHMQGAIEVWRRFFKRRGWKTAQGPNTVSQSWHNRIANLYITYSRLSDALKQTGFADALKKLGLDSGTGSDGVLPTRRANNRVNRQAATDSDGCNKVLDNWKSFNKTGDAGVPGLIKVAFFLAILLFLKELMETLMRTILVQQ